MAQFSDQYLDDLRARLPVSAVVGRAHKLRKQGAELVAVDDPSLTCNDAKHLWHDFGKLNTGGDIFDWFVKIDGRSFPEAVAECAALAGVPLPDGSAPRRANGANGAHPSNQGEKIDTGPAEEAKREIEATFDYRAADGSLVFQVVRYVFRLPDGSYQKTKDGKRKKLHLQRRPDGAGGWIWKMEGVRTVPYRVPELSEAIADDRTIFIAEGEKKCDALARIGLTATTNAAGAGKWPEYFREYFAGARVVILPDNDEAGRKHADQVAANIADVVASVMVLDLPDLPPKGDIVDWLAEGGTREDLEELVGTAAREWTAAVETFRSQLGAIWFHEVGRSKPTRNWLFKSLLLARTFGIAYGPPGCGKSFLVSDMSLRGAATKFLPGDGRPHWFGYKGRPFGTVYVVAEGRDDFEIRLHAWREEHRIPWDAVIPFVFLPTSIDMRSNDVDTAKLASDVAGLSAEMLQRCGAPCELVVIDTVARVLAGGNENASEVMTAFVRNCGNLQEQLNVTVLGVHHGGKEGGRGPRGHEALHGAADFEWEVIGGAPGVLNQFVVRKLKAGPGGAVHRFKLRQVKVGMDNDGDAITSCAVVPVGEEEAQNRALAADGFALRKQEEPIFRALMDSIRKHGNAANADHVAAGVPEGVLVVDYLAWRDAYKEVAEPNADGSALNDEAIRKRFRDYSPGMVKHRVMGWCRPWLWWTGRVIRGFPETKPKPVVETWTGSAQWSDEALDQAIGQPDQERTVGGHDGEF